MYKAYFHIFNPMSDVCIVDLCRPHENLKTTPTFSSVQLLGRYLEKTTGSYVFDCCSQPKKDFRPKLILPDGGAVFEKY